MNFTDNLTAMIALFNMKINLEAYYDKLAENLVKDFTLQGNFKETQDYTSRRTRQCLNSWEIFIKIVFHSDFN